MPEPEKPWVHMYTLALTACGDDTLVVFQVTTDWSLVTCPACRELEPKPDGVADR